MSNSGAILDHIDYKAFGGLWNESNPDYRDQVLFPGVIGGGPRHSYSFTSRETDWETGLQYNRGRYYKFDIGRWMSEDPIRWAGGDSNLYRYVGNDPTNATDPSGLFIKKWAKAVWNHTGGLVYDLVANASQAHATNEQAAAVGAGHEEYSGLRDAVQAGVRGLDIGLRGTVNGLVTAARSTVTLGIVDSPWQLMSVDHLSPEDRALYNQSFAFANAGGELLLGLAPGALASRCGRMAKVASAANAFDAAGNVVSVVRGVAEGDPLRAVMGLVGLGGNAATMRQLNSLPCFTGEMEVITERGYVRWDELKEQEDYVASCDEHDPFGKIEFKLVEEVFRSTAVIWHVHVAGRVIRTTAEHPFYVWGKGWVAAWLLKPGDQLRSHGGETIQVEDVLNTGAEETVYNCRVADYHTYFVAQDQWSFSVWSHNRPCADPRRLRGGYDPGAIHQDHTIARVFGGTATRPIPAGMNLRKGGLEGELRRYERYLVTNGMKPTDARAVIASEIESLGRDVIAAPFGEGGVNEFAMCRESGGRRY